MQELSFTEFVMTRSAALHRTAVLLTRDQHAAHDLLQEALLKAWRAWGRITDQPEAYVRTIMVRQLIDDRRRRWRGELPSETLPEQHGSTGSTGLAGRQTSPVTDVETRLTLEDAITALPPQQRAVVVLPYYHDLTEAETARTLGVSVGTVKSHHSRALAALRISDQLGDASGVTGRRDR